MSIQHLVYPTNSVLLCGFGIKDILEPTLDQCCLVKVKCDITKSDMFDIVLSYRKLHNLNNLDLKLIVNAINASDKFEVLNIDDISKYEVFKMFLAFSHQ